MCLDRAGCTDPDSDHGDSGHITWTRLVRAAAASGLTPAQAAANILRTAQATGNGPASVAKSREQAMEGGRTMAEISKSAKHSHRLTAAMIPDSVRDRLSEAELSRRTAYAEVLAVKARDAGDAAIAKGYRDLATAVLKAAPRDEVAAQHRQLTDKANAMPPGPERKRVLAAAQRLLDENPQAPEDQARSTGPVSAGGTRIMGRQPVAKAGDAGPSMVAVYDAHGCLIGVAPADKVTPLQGNGAGCKQPEGVAKAANAGPKSRPARSPVRR